MPMVEPTLKTTLQTHLYRCFGSGGCGQELSEAPTRYQQPQALLRPGNNVVGVLLLHHAPKVLEHLPVEVRRSQVLVALRPQHRVRAPRRRCLRCLGGTTRAFSRRRLPKARHDHRRLQLADVHHDNGLGVGARRHGVLPRVHGAEAVGRRKDLFVHSFVRLRQRSTAPQKTEKEKVSDGGGVGGVSRRRPRSSTQTESKGGEVSGRFEARDVPTAELLLCVPPTSDTSGNNLFFLCESIRT